jgi:hypothetical protein
MLLANNTDWVSESCLTSGSGNCSCQTLATLRSALIAVRGNGDIGTITVDAPHAVFGTGSGQLTNSALAPVVKLALDQFVLAVASADALFTGATTWNDFAGNRHDRIQGMSRMASQIWAVVEAGTKNLDHPCTASPNWTTGLNLPAEIINLSTDQTHVLGGTSTLSATVTPTIEAGAARIQWMHRAPGGVWVNAPATAPATSTAASYTTPVSLTVGVHQFRMIVTATNAGFDETWSDIVNVTVTAPLTTTTARAQAVTSLNRLPSAALTNAQVGADGPALNGISNALNAIVASTATTLGSPADNTNTEVANINALITTLRTLPLASALAATETQSARDTQIAAFVAIDGLVTAVLTAIETAVLVADVAAAWEALDSSFVWTGLYFVASCANDGTTVGCSVTNTLATRANLVGWNINFLTAGADSDPISLPVLRREITISPVSPSGGGSACNCSPNNQGAVIDSGAAFDNANGLVADLNDALQKLFDHLAV